MDYTNEGVRGGKRGRKGEDGGEGAVRWGEGSGGQQHARAKLISNMSWWECKKKNLLEESQYRWFRWTG